MKRSLEMPVADGRTDGTEFIGPLSAVPGVQKNMMHKKKIHSAHSEKFLETKIEVACKPGTAIKLAKVPDLRSVTINKIEKLAFIIVKGAKVKGTLMC